MASKRRVLVLSGAVLLALVLCGSVLFSQAPPTPTGPGNEVGAPTPTAPMPPGVPGPPGAGPPEVPTAAEALAGEEMPAELRMTYQEAVAEHPGIAEAGIPLEYRDQELSLIEWRQLARIFLGRVVEVVAAEGRVGRVVRPPLQLDISQRQIEMEIMGDLHEEAVSDGFWFEVGMPKVTADVAAPQARPETCTVRVGVVMHSKPKFANRVLQRLKNYSGRSEAREPFYFITDRGGYFKQHRLFLAQEAISYWGQLWASNVVELTVYDVNDRRLIPPIQQPAVHNGSTICDMVRPPTLYYAPGDWRHTGGAGAGAGMGAGSAMGYGEEEGGGSTYAGPPGGGYGAAPGAPGGAAGAGETTFFPFASRPVENRHADGGATTIPVPSWVGEKIEPPRRYSHLPERELWKRQDGKPMKIDGAKGWYFHFEFQMPIGRVGDIDHCTAELISLPLGAAGAPGAGPMGMAGGYGYEEE